MSRWEQISCSFSESGGRYISPRPSSFVPHRAGTKCPKGGGSRSPKIKRGAPPWGLPALMSIKQDRVGLSMAAHELHWLSQSSTPQPGMHRYLDKYFYWLPHIPIGHILSPNGIRQVELCANSTNKPPLETANSFSIGFQRIKLFLSIPINIVG